MQHVCEVPTQPGRMGCLALARTDVRPRQAGGMSPYVEPAGLTPADLQSAYRLPSKTAGSGQTVAVVVAFDNPNAETDLAVYRAKFGLPPCTTANGCFRKVNQMGLATPLPSPDPRWAAESALDTQMVSAACPNCKILLVEASSDFSTDLFVGIAAAVALGAKVVSNSYGSPEYPDQVTDGEMLAHRGIAMTVASGDSGYGVSFPASSPHVTAVGGTSLARAANSRGWSESVWLGAGSGCSAYEPKPKHQADNECATRSVADIAAVADPQTGVAAYNSYQSDGWRVYGGTSAAAPIIAGAYALAGNPNADSLPSSYPYHSPAALFDITTGANGACDGGYLCTAQPGYDGPTGLGTPNGVGALRVAGPLGRVEGVVSDAGTGRPVPAARVSVGTAVTYADYSGRFALELPAGNHELHVAASGFRARTIPNLAVEPGAVASAEVRLDRVPEVTLSGSIWDGSGHGWSLYAELTAEGVPGSAVFTDPVTGLYSIRLPGGTTHRLQLTPRYQGYQYREITVELGETDQALDIPLFVDQESCVAPGYRRSDTTSACEPVEGGLIVGNVREAATGAAVNGALVRSPDRYWEAALSLPTPDDDQLADGFFWLFSTLTGAHPFSAVRRGYLEQLTTITVVPETTGYACLTLLGYLAARRG